LRRHARQGLCGNLRVGRCPPGPRPARRRLQPSGRLRLRRTAQRSRGDALLHRLPLGMRYPRLGGDGLRRRRRAGPADRPVAAHVRRRRSRQHAAHLSAAGAARRPAQPSVTREADMRTGNLILLAAILVAVIASFVYLGIDLGALVGGDSLAQMGQYAGAFLQPDFSAPHLQAIGRGALETLAMSAIGTLLAALLGLALALPAAGRFGGLALHATRLLLNALRAIPELVWAALMVLAAGLGPNAGTLALALHTAGVLGRLF